MMRYQRVISPDCVPLSNGNGTKKPINREQDTITRFRSPSSSSSTQQDLTFQQSIEQPHHHHHHHHHDSSSSPSPSRGSGDMLLQWGQKKRSRVSRTEIHKNLNMEDSSSSLSAVSLVQVVRQRRLPNHSGSTPKKLLNSNIMPPPPTPPPLPSSSSSSNGTRARKEVLLSHRNLEDRSGTNGSPSRICGGGVRSTVGKSEKKVSSSCLARLGNDKVCDRLNSNHVHSTTTVTEHHHHHLHDHNNSVVVEKVNVEALEWPRIFLALSRKEKEDDFLAMKGTKLPQRPKKRPKNVDRALQYCFPGMWLSDLTRNRYEVREKKCVKKQKQRRGLKGMESLDSDSE